MRNMEVFVSHDFSKDFFAAYHAAVMEALGKDAVKYNSKIGILLAGHWLKRLQTMPAVKSQGLLVSVI